MSLMDKEKIREIAYENADILTCCFLPKDHPDYLCGNLFDGITIENFKNEIIKEECRFYRISSMLSY